MVHRSYVRSYVEYAASLTRALRAQSITAPELTAHLEEFVVAVLAADDHGRYLAANERACVLTGYARSELLGLTVADLLSVPPAGGQPPSWDVFIEEGYQHGTAVLRRKDGGSVAVDYDAYGNLAPGVHVSFLTAGR